MKSSDQVINDQEFKQLLLEEMTYFDEFCTKHEITYFLFYGSMLGAARHGGFIPWDDDIDVAVPYIDYIKLVNLFNQESARYKLVSFQTNSKYTLPLPKIIDTKTKLIQDYHRYEKVDLGIYIDIFVFNGVPDKKDAGEKYLNKAKRMTKGWIHATSEFEVTSGNLVFNILKYIYHTPNRIIGYKYYLEKMNSLAKKYDFYSSIYVSNLSFVNIDCLYLLEDFVPIRMKFENREFVMPKGYDRLLTQRYGDWRKLPEINMQKSEHRYKCYYAD